LIQQISKIYNLAGKLAHCQRIVSQGLLQVIWGVRRKKEVLKKE